MQKERWEVIPTYPDYKISTSGVVYSLKRNKEVKPYNSNTVELFNADGSKSWTIQTLLACTFLGLDITDPFRNRVLFKDEDTHNIQLDNLYVEDTSDLPGEEWRPLTAYGDRLLQDHYQVSNKGRLKAGKHVVHTSFRGKPVDRNAPDIILKPETSDAGYYIIRMHCAEGKDANVAVHRAVAQVFCANDDPQHKTFVNHIDSNKLNNYAANLEWCTPRENMQHAISSGRVLITSDTFIHQPVIHVETGIKYKSMSEASRAMGKWYGYIAERTRLGKNYVDSEGNEWTLQFVDVNKPKKSIFNI